MSEARKVGLSASVVLGLDGSGGEHEFPFLELRIVSLTEVTLAPQKKAGNGVVVPTTNPTQAAPSLRSEEKYQN